MNHKNQWIIEMSQDKALWCESVLNDSIWPAPIVFNYNCLKEMMSEGNVYGALLQIKDLYEIILKISVITTLIYLDKEYEEVLLEKTDIIDYLLQNRLSIGCWNLIANKILGHNKKDKNDNRAKKVFLLPKDLTTILIQTTKLFEKKVGNKGNVMKWRNDTIGHGMLKFEDDENYRLEFRTLLNNLQVYFNGESTEAYKNIYYSYECERFSGLNTINDKDTQLYLHINELSIEVNKYSIRSFFFDSFRLNEKEVKYIDYISGKDDIRSIKLFSNYIEKYNKGNEDLGKTVNNNRVLDSEDDLYSYLNTPDHYIIPEGFKTEINDFFDNSEKGIITICIERGTGKTAFAYSVDGIYGKVGDSFFPRTVVRTYSLNTANTRGINDFFGYINYIFTRTEDGNTRDSEIEFPRISIKDENPKESMVAVLNAFREYYDTTYGYDRLVLVLDGLDELTEEMFILNNWFINSLDENLLDDGVYIIYTSRFVDELQDN